MVAEELFGQLTDAEELCGQVTVAEGLFGQLTDAEELFGQVTVAEALLGQLSVAEELVMVASTGRQLWPLKIYKKKITLKPRNDTIHLKTDKFSLSFRQRKMTSFENRQILSFISAAVKRRTPKCAVCMRLDSLVFACG